MCGDVMFSTLVTALRWLFCILRYGACTVYVESSTGLLAGGLQVLGAAGIDETTGSKGVTHCFSMGFEEVIYDPS